MAPDGPATARVINLSGCSLPVGLDIKIANMRLRIHLSSASLLETSAALVGVELRRREQPTDQPF